MRIPISESNLNINKAPLARSTSPQVPSAIVIDSFDDFDTIARRWIVDPSGLRGVEVQVPRVDGNGVMSLTLPEAPGVRELDVRRAMNVTAVRGHRVRLSARIRMLKSEGASARVRISAPNSMEEATYSDFADSRAISSESWTSVYAVIDVSRTASRGEIALILSGGGTAWFDDVRVVSLGPSPVAPAMPLTASLRERLTTLAHVLGLIRYFHPSDESANLDWNTFSIRAVETLLRADHTQPFQKVLEALFVDVAPTARFLRSGESAQRTLPQDPKATHLVRWRHMGLGSESSEGTYFKFRDGIDAEESAFTYLYTIVNVPHLESCQSADVRADVRITSASGTAYLFAKLLQSGQRSSYVQQPITARQTSDTVEAHGDIPSDVHQVQLGVYLVGRSAIELSKMSFRCHDGTAIHVNANSTWSFSREGALYKKETTSCAAGTCLLAYRNQLSKQLRPRDDIADVDVGSGLHIIFPIAVWSDGSNTFPHRDVAELPPPDFALMDPSVRLAAVMTTWVTLSWFYPYFGDQQTNWSAMLPRVLDEAAAAVSPGDLHAVLSRLVAELHDGHARVRHPTQSMLGMLPVALHAFDDRILVTGGLSEYLKSIPVGSEIVAIDDVPVRQAYAAKYATVSAATTAFRDYLSLVYVGIGKLGSLRHLRVRTLADTETETVLPLVSRESLFDDIREPRPKSGSEIQSSIFYVDPITLDQDTVSSLIPGLKNARAVILDMRGYIKNGVFDFLAHFLKHEVSSPKLEIPIVSVYPDGERQDVGWLLWPAAPPLTARLVVLTDVRAVSAAETVLQILHDNHLATFVGESSAGTNGDVNTFGVPGGFEVRFTGMRVSGPDGSTIHGRGITPDVIVHPTAQGVRAGRDEILEAGIAIAQRLLPN